MFVAAGCATMSDMDKQEAAMRQAIGSDNSISVVRNGDQLQLIVKADLTFAINSSALKENAITALQKAAKVLNAYPSTNIEVAGHTDSTGTDAINDRLSVQRAEAVKAVLVNADVASSRVTTIGYGSRRPVADNNTSEGRAKNRRVDITVTPIKVQK